MELAQFDRQATHTSFGMKYIQEMSLKRQRLKYLLGETNVDPYATKPIVTTAPAGYASDRKSKNQTQIIGTLAIAGLIGYSIGKKYKQPIIGALVGVYLPTFIGGNFGRKNISLTRGIAEVAKALQY